MNDSTEPFWSLPAERLFEQLGSSPRGLSSPEAAQRLAEGRGSRLEGRPHAPWRLFLAQFKSPITLILIVSAALSVAVADPVDAAVILGIILASAALGFWQEQGAATVMNRLLAVIKTRVSVLRDGRDLEIDAEAILPGDVVRLSAGGKIPGDCLIVEAKDLFVEEAALTGETYPVEKRPGPVAPLSGLVQRINSLFLGTHVVSGTALALVVHTGRHTEFGAISEHLKLARPETDFERGVRRFGYFLMEVTLLLVVAIFAINAIRGGHESVLEAFMFSLALAVGLTPQLLPAIISVNLAHGARRMAARNCIVRRLASIENFGSMDVLCSDKTGTLTEGLVEIQSALDPQGNESESVLFHAWLNAALESGFANPIDEAIRRRGPFPTAGYVKVDEVPYDFVRKRLSILVSHNTGHLLITKGALDNVLDVCTQVAGDNGATLDLETVREELRARRATLGDQGYRILGVAVRELGSTAVAGKDVESGLTFLGMLVLRDPPKPGVRETVEKLARLGVSLKMITGDNRFVAAHVAEQVGLSARDILTGPDLRRMSDVALWQRAVQVEVFAEVEPNQKERIILALRKAGKTVGYLGDGINDASALHAADVGISVDQAVDVAKEAADIVLLKHDLDVLVDGIQEGRATFANTLKYVFMATSANFGNMFSMAFASLWLPFLPLLPKQILLMNVLTDIPEMTIATDRVDPELVEQPRHWDLRLIRNFMFVFGTISSVFDFLMFAVLRLVLGATEPEFRTGWFLESVISAALVVLVVRSQRPLTRSLPSRPLVASTAVIVLATALLPLTPLARPFGLAPVSALSYLAMGGIVGMYVLTAEIAKAVIRRRMGTRPGGR